MPANPPQTLVAWIAAVASAQPRRPAVFGGADAWTYRELWERSEGIARHLAHERQATVGDRVAMVGANEPDYLTAYLGILRAGCVAVPLNPMLDVPSLKDQLDLVGASATIVGKVQDEIADGLAETGTTWPLAELPTPSASSLPQVGPDSPACILPTSGSTGRPKGVVHSHGTLLHAALQLASGLPFGPEERTLAFLPFHASIPEQVLPTLCTGGSVDVLPKFDIELVATAAASATNFDMVPTIMARLLADAPLEGLAKLRWVMFASEPMPVTLLRRWWDAVPEVEAHQLYGMTEVLPMTFARHRLLREEPSTVGVPFGTSRLFIADTAGEEQKDGGEGEIICRSPASMLGYYGDKEASRAALTPDGGMRTGDLGRIDANGRVFLTGRLKDLIISGGMNIAPAEIEEVACRHPGVLSAAVVGVPDDRWGETPIVVAVPVAGNGLAALDVLKHCRQELPSFKRPSAAALVETLPSTGIGKSAKSLIRQQVLDGQIPLVRLD